MSIQNELNRIKHAIKGEEVRGAIHDGIKKAYDDASEKDNANMEVKIARGTHPNLRSRLEEVDNKQQQTTAQLAQKAEQADLVVHGNKKATAFEKGHVSADGISIVVDDDGVISAIGTSGGGVATNYDPATTYAATDVITFGGKIFVSKISNNLGNKPSDFPEYWKEYQSDEFSIVSSKNLYNPNLAVDRVIASFGDGIYSDYPTSAMLGKYPVEEDRTYTLSIPETENGFFAVVLCYDTQMNYLGISAPLSSFKVVDSVSSTRKTSNGRKQMTVTINQGSPVKFIDTSIIYLYAEHTTQDFDRIRNSIQIEEGTEFTSYEKFGFRTTLKPNALPEEAIIELIQSTVTSDDSLTVIIDESQQTYDVSIVSKFDDNKNLIQNMLVLKNETEGDKVNNVVNAMGVSLYDNTSGTSQSLQSQGDEAAPIYFNGGYIGANHGYIKTQNIYLANHGKTYADIGSSWVDDSGMTFYIIRYIDANNIWVLGENVFDSDIFGAAGNIVGSLTHVEGARNTQPLSGFIRTAKQLRPATKNLTKKVLLNGKKEISNNGTYYGKSVDIVEFYDIVNPFSALDKIRANKPVGGYTKNPPLNDGDSVVSVSNIYRFFSDGTNLIITDITNHLDIDFGYFGITQQGASSDAFGGGVYKYLPKSLPLTEGSTVYDLRTPIDNANIVDALHYTSPYWEMTGNPPDRTIDYFKDSNGDNQLGFALGYLPIGDGIDRANKVEDAWFINNTKKNYPKFVDSKLGSPLPKDTSIQGIAYRKFYPLNDLKSSGSVYLIPFNNETLVYIDYHKEIDEHIELPKDLVGRSFTIIEKTDNVKIFGSMVTDKIRIKVSLADPMYGYAVLKIQMSSKF